MKVIHTAHDGLFAKKFVLPIVQHIAAYHQVCLCVGSVRRMDDVSSFTQVVFKDTDVSLNPFVFLKRCIIFFNWLRSERPDVLHAHTTRGSLLPLWVAKTLGIRMRVYHNHGVPYVGYQGVLKWCLAFLDWLNLCAATHVLTVSKASFHALKRMPSVRSQRTMQWLGRGSVCGVSLSEFTRASFSPHMLNTVRRKLAWSQASCVFGYVGRPVKRKGFHVLLHAWKASELGTKGAVLLLAGCSLEDCMHICDGVMPRGVIALGMVSDMVQFYQWTDVIVLPSFHEGFSYALLEGAAMGRLLVVSHKVGEDDLLEPLETALFFDAITRDAVAAKMKEIFHMPARSREQIGCRARARVEAYFDRDMFLKHYDVFYKHLEDEGFPALDVACVSGSPREVVE